MDRQLKLYKVSIGRKDKKEEIDDWTSTNVIANSFGEVISKVEPTLRKKPFKEYIHEIVFFNYVDIV